ncbi:hypothetical protein PACTADRAFT_52239 [Pachysolen tannophilus NRRL Y-2460]|uniref:NADPH:adrenodoxin oxidoreductase, mitochondrial n=1 Tax=Pachysolen tannophilus NRRL Y-2460 TaxID=669874 RepID=A0A1E4U0H5_PACTA|nr:hypothetical protein PACTADRAFT_52239 [Pachysolen tannophilus NRRL Y-2460]
MMMIRSINNGIFQKTIFKSTLNRFHSTKVAIIGSGPSGFYTAYHLLKKSKGDLKVDVFEKLPVPYGLVRFGVAPDHPEVKNCTDTFEEISNSPDFSFFGNVKIGKDVSLKELRDNYNCIVFSYGCDEDNLIGLSKIPGIDSKGVITARKFVGWYNGLPDFQDLNPPLDQVENVIIIGNGNVALDVARTMLVPIEAWSKTDITANAQNVLKKSKVKNVKIVARRGFLQTAFTNKEFRELLELYNYGVGFSPVPTEFLDPVRPFIKNFGRVHKRRLELIDRYFEAIKQNVNFPKTFELDYLKSPIEVKPSSKNPAILESTKFQVNNLLEDDEKNSTKVVPTDITITYKNELLITSTGYRGSALPGFEEFGIAFDEKRGRILNEHGRIKNSKNPDSFVDGFYSSGWISKGPTGVIASTMIDSFDTGDLILEDKAQGKFESEPKEGAQGIAKILQNRNHLYVTWKDWKKLEAKEIQDGKKVGKLREKITDVDKMLDVLRNLK